MEEITLLATEGGIPQGGMNMIDYEEELKKFEPCLDVTDAESAIYDRELTDILDILQEMLRESKSGRRVK